MNMKDKTHKWIDAANILRHNINAKVICPECGIGNLTVKDELIKNWPSKIDRYIICNYCGKYNILTMNKNNDSN